MELNGAIGSYHIALGGVVAKDTGGDDLFLPRIEPAVRPEPRSCLCKYLSAAARQWGCTDLLVGEGGIMKKVATPTVKVMRPLFLAQWTPLSAEVKLYSMRKSHLASFSAEYQVEKQRAYRQPAFPRTPRM